MVGFLGIGRKVNEEDYAPEELNVLGSLASQVALASENIRLLEENIAKRRLEEQMEIARKIQEGFLPRVLPDTPRLEVAAGSRFSLEVAGDYYDVITLEGGETVLAVGDVSGKGAGAALIMANLQASLRTAIRMGVPLSEAIARVNELIYNNTPSDQFITCFVGMYSPAEHKLTYVNAGHNAPIVARENGTIERLEATGLILGVLPVFVYDVRSIVLERGDVVLMFTDGVSEAMSKDEIEYGEDRIVEFARKYRRASTKELLNALERDVNEFFGRVPTEDDSTVVSIKRV
jgi:sigma-B regulation protein RsbU (phosphoserine phosphatase)